MDINTDQITAWVDERIKTALAEAIPAAVEDMLAGVMANEDRLIRPLTAYMDAKIGQMEQTLPGLIAQAFKSILPHWLEHGPTPPEEK